VALYIADFDSHSVDAAPSGWTARWTTTNSTWAIRSKTGIPFQVLEHTASSTGARRLLSWDSLDSDADRANVEVLALIRSNSTVSLQNNVLVRGAGAAGSETAYGLVTNNTAFHLNKWVSGTSTQLGSTLSTPAFTAGTWYWVRLRVNGTAIKAKVWLDGTAEPASWSSEVTDSAVAAAGWVGVGAFQASGIRDFGYVAIGTNGDSPAFITVNPRLYQAAAETLVQGDPQLHISQAALEFLVGEPIPLRVHQAAVEVLVDNNTPAAPPSGGDYVIINVCT